jgi:hypothetical protein
MGTSTVRTRRWRYMHLTPAALDAAIRLLKTGT